MPKPRILPFSLLVTALVLPSVLHAQTAADAPNEAREAHMAGRKSMEEADTLERQGNHAEARRIYARACSMFQKALTLSPKRASTQAALAFCHMAMGRPATALEAFRLAKEWGETQSTTDPATAQSNAIAAKTSAEEIAKLEATVPRLHIKVPAEIRSLSGLRINRNGVAVIETQWDTAFPVDPGKYDIEVSAPDRTPWRTVVDVKMGKSAEVSIPADWGAEKGHGPSSPQSSARRTVGFVGIGIGGAALVTGGILGAVALSKDAESKENDHCDATNACDPVGMTLRQDAFTLGHTSTAMFAIGGALALGGIILVATAPAAKKDAGVQTSVWLGAGTVHLQGRW